ncbi:MAG: transglycosylase SLT domain-containing protein [Betaproteobacteria bacterium]
MTMLHTMRILLAGALLGLASAPACAAGQDDDFLAAREAFRTGDAARVDRYAQRLKGYILEPYVAYWRLRMRLDSADPSELRSFIGANQDSAVSERLRIDWLKALGARQQWDLFDAEFPRLARDDIELTCYSLQSRMRSAPTEALAAARALWFVGRDSPESCAPLFGALVAGRQLREDEIWMRIRLALEAGQVSVARRAADYLPPRQEPDHKLLGAISANPRAFLDRKSFDFKNRAGRETVMFAVHRLARSSPQQAATHWTRHEERFAAEDRAYVWGLLAQYAAMRHDPSALSWFERAGDLSDLQLAWKARAALRARDWATLLAAIDAMTEREKSDSGWRYWRARALAVLGQPEEAETIFRSLSPEFSFYGQLATEELGQRIANPAASFRPAASDIKAMSAQPGVRRALELYRLGLRFDGVREWLWTIRNFDDRQLLAAAEVARRAELYDRAINTADRTVSLHDFELRYLAPYRDILKPRVSELGLDEAWVYGLIRQESRFISDARSSAGASGLMQLMPNTARWVAKKLGLKDWRWTQVTEIDTNVSLGTYYLRHVYDVLDEHPVLASAAYNAGPGRARAWRPGSAMEGAVYAETIPFNETRDYVKRVMANTSYYAHAFSQELQSLKQRLGIIGPRLPDREAALGDTP